jgi:AraC-like DNA-binding protein
MRYGADDYIPKPFSPALLIGRSIALIQQRDKLRQAYTQTKGKDDEILHPSDNNQQEANAPLISSERDRKFREIVDMKINSNLSNPDFVVDDLAQATGYGRSQFYSKMMEVTGKTPKEYIRQKRMSRAAELLHSGEMITVAEVAYQVGFSDSLYFSRCFKQYFGVTPSKYQKG